MIALFASSAALEDLRDTSHLTTEQQERFLDKLDSQYRYGSYVGGDGSVHIGMEKVPLTMGADTATERGMETEGGMEKETQKRYAHITLDVFEGGLETYPSVWKELVKTCTLYTLQSLDCVLCNIESRYTSSLPTNLSLLNGLIQLCSHFLA